MRWLNRFNCHVSCQMDGETVRSSVFIDIQQVVELIDVPHSSRNGSAIKEIIQLIYVN